MVSSRQRRLSGVVSIKAETRYLDYSGRDDVLNGGVRMVPIRTHKGEFKVAVVVRQAVDRGAEVDAACEVGVGDRFLEWACGPDDRPPASPPRHPAFVGDDGEKSRPGSTELRPDPVVVAASP